MMTEQIKLAANFSQPLLKLMKEKKTSVDLIKLSVKELAEEEGQRCTELGLPALIHYLPDLGAPTADWQRFDFQTLNRQIKAWSVPHLSLHLDAYKKVAQVQTRAELLALCSRNARLIQEKVSVPLLVENVDQEPDWNPAGNYDRYPEVAEINFFQDFLRDNPEIGWLLDLSHARCLTHYWQMPTQAYLEKMPLARVVEIHINGPKVVNGEMCDVHEKMVTVDYELLNWTLDKTTPKIVTLEYGGVGKMYETEAKNNEKELQEQLSNLQVIINKGEK